MKESSRKFFKFLVLTFRIGWRRKNKKEERESTVELSKRWVGGNGGGGGGRGRRFRCVNTLKKEKTFD